MRLPFPNFRRLFNLRRDQATPEIIDATIRGNAELAGTNLWVLMLAILMASIGLNVNSTAVIIGAMLISPLMGPIIGMGYAVGVHDFALIRRAFRHLAIFVSISLAASTLYFTLTPLTEAHAELLARTSPNLWDVLIALVGGAAGMIALTRTEKTTVIPGVAIATALMPPLCTAGYGIATLQPTFFLGAFYLFFINGLFIGLATLGITRLLRLPYVSLPDSGTRKRVHLIIVLLVIGTLIPSSWLAYRLVQQEVFNSRAQRLLNDELAAHPQLTLISREVDAQKRHINITLMGSPLPDGLVAELNAALPTHGLARASLSVHQFSEQDGDWRAVRREMENGLIQSATSASRENAARIMALETRLARQDALSAELPRIEAEIRAQLPALHAVAASLRPPSGNEQQARVTVLLHTAHPPPAGEMQRLERWLAARLPTASVHVVVTKP